MVACGDGGESDTGSINNANQGGAGQAGAAGQTGAGAAGTGQGGQAGADPGKVCTPGLTQVCLGPGACNGAQSCLPSGEQWGPCDCGSGQGGESEQRCGQEEALPEPPGSRRTCTATRPPRTPRSVRCGLRFAPLAEG